MSASSLKLSRTTGLACGFTLQKTGGLPIRLPLRYLPFLVRKPVDILCFDLGIQDLLRAIQAEITGQCVTDGTRKTEQRKVLGPKQFHAQNDGRQRTIDRSAEHADQTDRRSEAGGQMQQSANDGAECRSYKE